LIVAGPLETKESEKEVLVLLLLSLKKQQQQTEWSKTHQLFPVATPRAKWPK
jgi:hypothetical protein